MSFTVFLWFPLRIDHHSLQMCSGICREGDPLVVGPTDSGQFHKLSIGSIQRNRSACRVLRAGQAATLALGNFDRSLLRKVGTVWSLLIFAPDREVVLRVICTACLSPAGDGDGEPRDEPHHLLEVWGRDRVALSRKDLSQGFPGDRAHTQRETNGHGGSCVWHGRYHICYNCFSETVPLLLNLAFVLSGWHRRNWGPGRKPWCSLSSSSTQNTWRWGPRCSSERA